MKTDKLLKFADTRLADAERALFDAVHCCPDAEWSLIEAHVRTALGELYTARQLLAPNPQHPTEDTHQ